MSTARTVAVVGAGPSGLIAAKTLLHSRHFDVTIFEKNSAIGGLWAPNNLINPQMRTNLCKFTNSFSGLSWENVTPHRKGDAAMIYPFAWQVNEYLLQFYRRYIPDGTVRFQTTVTGAELVVGEDGISKWQVSTSGSLEKSETQIFDFLVVAPGCFSNAHMPPWLPSFQQETGSRCPTLHSTQYQEIADMIRNTSEAGSKVLIVGCSHSGSDVATEVALHILSRTHRLSQDAPKIICVSSHLKMYNRSNLSGDNKASFTYTLFSPEVVQSTTEMLLSLKSGERQTLRLPEVDSMQLNVIINSSFSQLVQYGAVQTLYGTLKRLKASSKTDRVIAMLETSEGKKQEVDNVVGVIFATGFDASASVAFLSSDVKKAMGYDEQCPTLPLVLDTSYLSQNMRVPNLAVIGFAAQFWGIMEMQARAITQAWTTGRFMPDHAKRGPLTSYWTEIRQIRKSNNRSPLSPNPFADYAGLMEQAARELGLERIDGNWHSNEGAIIPARYVDKTSTTAEKEEALKQIEELQRMSLSIKDTNPFIAKAVFSALLGKWYVKANEVDHEGGLRLREFRFHPRHPTDDDYDYEYYASEDCPWGEERMVFRFVEGTQRIIIWKAHPETMWRRECYALCHTTLME